MKNTSLIWTVPLVVMFAIAPVFGQSIAFNSENLEQPAENISFEEPVFYDSLELCDSLHNVYQLGYIGWRFHDCGAGASCLGGYWERCLELWSITPNYILEDAIWHVYGFSYNNVGWTYIGNATWQKPGDPSKKAYLRNFDGYVELDGSIPGTSPGIWPFYYYGNLCPSGNKVDNMWRIDFPGGALSCILAISGATLACLKDPALSVPSLIYPDSADTDLPTEIEFAWNSVPEADKYFFFLREDTSWVVWDSNVIDTTYNVDCLDYSTDYNWMVWAYNGCEFASSHLWSFATKSAECKGLGLVNGWNWVSTNIDPSCCTSFDSLLIPCDSLIDIVIACDGAFCIPGVGCWIDCWNVSEMYKIHTSDVCTAQVCGSKVLTNTPILLPQGWGCIAYFPECPLEPETALVSIWDNLNIVKNDEGRFCIPGIGCWIDYMEHSEGYKVHLANVDTLIYPTSCPLCSPPIAKRDSHPGLANTAHFNYLGNTGESYSIAVNSVKVNGKNPEAEDEIGIFTPSGLCVGGGVWQGDILGIAAWQDDDRTEIVDGFKVDELMIFKLWDRSENKEVQLSACFEKGDGKFGTDAYALVGLNGISPRRPMKPVLVRNYPNPFNPETEISYQVATAGHIRLSVYNVLGRKVRTLVDEDQSAGPKTVKWDGKDDSGKDVASGIYFYQLKSGDYVETMKMLLLK